ncbi:hypothetical protein [Kitasatospora sp. NPDC087314]
MVPDERREAGDVLVADIEAVGPEPDGPDTENTGAADRGEAR